MNCFDFTLEDGADVLVEYEPVDEDDHGEIEFEFYVFDESGKDIWDELSAKDQTEIEAQAGLDWQQYVADERAEAAISRWEIERDFP
jgi:hypothetical protein